MNIIIIQLNIHSQQPQNTLSSATKTFKLNSGSLMIKKNNSGLGRESFVDLQSKITSKIPKNESNGYELFFFFK